MTWSEKGPGRGQREEAKAPASRAELGGACSARGEGGSPRPRQVVQGRDEGRGGGPTFGPCWRGPGHASLRDCAAGGAWEQRRRAQGGGLACSGGDPRILSWALEETRGPSGGRGAGGTPAFAQRRVPGAVPRSRCCLLVHPGLWNQTLRPERGNRRPSGVPRGPGMGRRVGASTGRGGEGIVRWSAKRISLPQHLTFAKYFSLPDCSS